MFAEYTRYDGLGLARLVKDGEVHPAELLEAAIHKAEALNPHLNVIVHTFYERARRRAEGPLPDGPFTGVPFLLKDLLDNLAGEPMRNGSRGFHITPEENSELVNRYLSTGLVPFGKTNTPELGLTITTEPKSHGPSHNPWRKGTSTGGSSGGSAAAVAAGIVPLASGSDGGGSIRFPSACCGVFGLKPSRGLNPLGPEHGDAWDGAVAAHVITRSVRDCAAMLDATAGPEIGAPYRVSRDPASYLEAVRQAPAPLRIFVSRTPLIEATVHPEALSGLEQTARLLDALGHHVEEADPDIDRDTLWRDYVTVVSAHVAAVGDMVKRELGPGAFRKLEPATLSMAMIGRSLSACDLVKARMGWHRVQLAMGRFMDRCDVFLTPTLVEPPLPHGTLTPSGLEDLSMAVGSRLPIGRMMMKTGMVRLFSRKTLGRMGFTLLGNVTGLPGVSIPLHWTRDGLPLGMLFTGRMGEERTLFRLAGQLEQERPWADRVPPLNGV
ncbi:amidase [Desulfatiferula olefinivorans]